MKPLYLLQEILSFRVVLKTGDVQLGIQSFCKIENMYFLQKEKNHFWQHRLHFWQKCKKIASSGFFTAI